MPKKNQQKRTGKLREIAALIRGVDLFCGAGGLTRGLEDSGINVRLGIDIDPACEYPYAENNSGSFLLKSVEEITAADLSEAFGDASFKLLAGCAPCQPFSTYSRTWSCPSDERWNLLDHFSRLIEETRPHLVTMENVPPLEREDVFADFVAVLADGGFEVVHGVVNCADYGVPQQRQRLVLLASTLGPIRLIDPTTPDGPPRNSQDGHRRHASAGSRASLRIRPVTSGMRVVAAQLERICASKPGGTWRDWDQSLRAACHRKKSGKTYPSVYGRMIWADPSPTMTTQYYGFGNGRFGHPEQDRAISLREGAILQSFPKTYKFVPEGEPVYRKTIGRLVGNAVPVELGAAIGRSIALHVAERLDSKERAA